MKRRGFIAALLAAPFLFWQRLGAANPVVFLCPDNIPDAEFLEQLEWSIEDVAQAFAIPRRTMMDTSTNDGNVYVNVADLTDPDDPAGRSYRQVNAAKVHNIALGTLVELESGARLFVVHLGRDCDQTPLYSLSAYPIEVDNTDRWTWLSGYAEESLTLVERNPDDEA